ncbi:U6 snRNA phosphodiesterase 1 isoform X2 [Centropristis striata]|uniref:U6 snRNA phosphodiesterase 1 isoform X2 n=1 Tax=Centropristis striata TaxID=184440 RepID=UPI0027E02FE6|nr:U6 snRNA phosphodiesterase 1 isoform X2 [Centropristis striata]
MLVGYSSSSEEESEAAEGTDGNKPFSPKRQAKDGGDDGNPARKKPRIEEELPKTRLPLPGCLSAMFPDEVGSETEDSALHGGRIRSFKHERGNWATYVYLPYHPDEEFRELLEELLSLARTHGAVLTPQEEFHLSLSQTVVLRHHWIQPFIQSLKAGLLHCKRFVCSAGRLKVYCNAERTRTFLGMEVYSGHAQLLDLVQVVDRTMKDFHLDTFYKDPSFHVSLAWCVGDLTEQMKECIVGMQSLIDDHEEGQFELRLDGIELRCRTGNKTFHFPLEL